MLVILAHTGAVAFGLVALALYATVGVALVTRSHPTLDGLLPAAVLATFASLVAALAEVIANSPAL